MDAYFSGTLNNKLALTKVLIKVYLINNLRVNILINIDVLTPYKFFINYIS